MAASIKNLRRAVFYWRCPWWCVLKMGFDWLYVWRCLLKMVLDWLCSWRCARKMVFDWLCTSICVLKVVSSWLYPRRCMQKVVFEWSPAKEYVYKAVPEWLCAWRCEVKGGGCLAGCVKTWQVTLTPFSGLRILVYIHQGLGERDTGTRGSYRSYNFLRGAASGKSVSCCVFVFWTKLTTTFYCICLIIVVVIVVMVFATRSRGSVLISMLTLHTGRRCNCVLNLGHGNLFICFVSILILWFIYDDKHWNVPGNKLRNL